jgi:hypothetical protein
MHISPIGVVPKKEVGQYRLIHNLSNPTDKSINDHIPGVQKKSPFHARSSYDSGSKVPCHLINTAELLLDAAIAPNTKSTYSTAIQQMLIFLDTYVPKAELVDFTVEKNVLFMAYLFEEGKSPNTISTYLEALSYYLKFKSKPDITNISLLRN